MMGVRVRVRIAIMHIVLRCRTGSLSCCLEVDFGVEVATWSCPRGLELLVGSGSWWWAMVHRAQIRVRVSKCVTLLKGENENRYRNKAVEAVSEARACRKSR